MFCVRGFGGGVGVSLFFGGVVLACPSCFLGLLGFSVFLVVLLLLLGWVAGCGGFRGSGSARPGVLLPSCWGAGLGCACARLSVLLPCLLGGGRGVRVLPGSRGGGRVVPGFFCCLLWWGFSGVVFFRPVLLVSSGSAVLGPLLGCGFRGVGGLWGVSGWVGVVFSPASAVLARACLGLGWVLFGEFDPGSGRTLAACLTHASRTGPPLWGWVEWRTGEYHVSNLPPAPG